MQDKIGMPLDEIHLSGHVPQCEFICFCFRYLFSGYVSLAFSLFFGRVEFSFILLCCSIFVFVLVSVPISISVSFISEKCAANRTLVFLLRPSLLSSVWLSHVNAG